MKAMTDGALIPVNLRSSHHRASICRHRRCADQFPFDPRMKRNPDDQPFQGKRRIGGCHWHAAKIEPKEYGDRHQNHSKDKSKETSHRFDSLRLCSS
jgi:hypothetical protein